MRTIETNPISEGEKIILDLDRWYGDFSKKIDAPSCFYNYAADRGADFSGFIDVETCDFIKSLGWND